MLNSEINPIKPLRRIKAIVASCWIYFTTRKFRRFESVCDLMYSEGIILRGLKEGVVLVIQHGKWS